MLNYLPPFHPMARVSCSRPLSMAVGTFPARRNLHPQPCLQLPPPAPAVPTFCGIGRTPFLLPSGLCMCHRSFLCWLVAACFFIPTRLPLPPSGKPALRRNRDTGSVCPVELFQGLRGGTPLPRPQHMVAVWGGLVRGRLWGIPAGPSSCPHFPKSLLVASGCR